MAHLDGCVAGFYNWGAGIEINGTLLASLPPPANLGLSGCQHVHAHTQPPLPHSKRRKSTHIYSMHTPERGLLSHQLAEG